MLVSTAITSGLDPNCNRRIHLGEGLGLLSGPAEEAHDIFKPSRLEGRNGPQNDPSALVLDDKLGAGAPVVRVPDFLRQDHLPF